MISKRDSKPFLIKFPIGVSKTTKTNMIYENDWQTLYGLISDPSGSLSRNVYGNEVNFDKVIIVNATSVSRKINYDTIFMIDDIPTINYPLGEYTPKYIYPEYNGEIVIGLSKTESINMPKLYFYNGNTLLYYQLNFDRINLFAYITSNSKIPFSTNEYVWTKEPSSSSTTTNRYKFSGSTKIGYDGHYKPFYKLTFITEE